MDQHQDMILSELNRQPLPFEKVVATWGILFARAMAGQRRHLVDTDTVEASNALFQKIFPPRLPEMMDMAVNDPQGYRDKISHIETSAPVLPMIEFETRGSYDLLIADDPLRNREIHFLLQAITINYQIEGDNLQVVDLGSGSGRILQAISKYLSTLDPGATFRGVGVDIGFDNISYAHTQELLKSGRQQAMFVAGDITDVPFKSETASITCANSVFQLIPLYRRPLILLEMIRILKANGEGVITGPNEKCSLETYIRSALASQPAVYLNPQRLMMAMEMTHFAITLDEMCQKSSCFSYLDSEETCIVLENLGCEILQVDTWPGFYPGEEIFTGIRFKKVSDKFFHIAAKGQWK